LARQKSDAPQYHGEWLLYRAELVQMAHHVQFTSFMETKRCPELNSPWKSDMAVVDSQLQGHIPDPNENLPTEQVFFLL
jgi:hypothetical protein